jgi:hypothetical protein
MHMRSLTEVRVLTSSWPQPCLLPDQAPSGAVPRPLSIADSCPVDGRHEGDDHNDYDEENDKEGADTVNTTLPSMATRGCLTR